MHIDALAGQDSQALFPESICANLRMHSSTKPGSSETTDGTGGPPMIFRSGVPREARKNALGKNCLGLNHDQVLEEIEDQLASKRQSDISIAM
jgi:hypothetical protein